MKKLLMALLALFCIYAAAAPSYADGYTGRGKSDDPYIISSAEQLKQFANEVSGGNNYYNTYFKLANDIDLGSEPWTPIGWAESGSIDFGGTFDGGGFTVKGLLVQSSNDYKGLFRSLGSSGVIKNLTVDGSVTGGNYIGGIVGQNSSGTIENCSSSVTATGKRYVGGIAGQNNAGKITDCSNSGAVSSTITTHTASSSYVGGIVGQNSAGVLSSGSINGCRNTGVISGSNYVGGITGYTTAQITRCSNFGAVSGSGYIGGVTGFIKGESVPGSLIPDEVRDASLTDCYNTGTVNGTARYTGGVAGQISTGGIVSNCYNTADVKGALIVGGVAGQINSRKASLKNCYNVGKVNASVTVGSVVGQDSSGVTELCYYLEGTAVKGIGSGLDSAKKLTAPEFTSLIDTMYSYGWTGGGTMDLVRPVLSSNKEIADFPSTEENPHIIDSLDSFNMFVNYINHADSGSGRYVKLACDMTTNNDISVTGYFTGVFDGGGHSIYLSTNYASSLFYGISNGGVVKNLNIGKYTTEFSDGTSNNAVIAKRVGSGGTIENCRVYGRMTASFTANRAKKYIYGGIASVVDAGGTIKNCTGECDFSLSFSASSNNNSVACVGCIAGENNGTIENCIIRASYYGFSFNPYSSNTAYIGGIAGKNTGTIQHCLNITAIPNQNNAYAGNNAYSIAYNEGGIIENCYYDADKTPNLGSEDKGLGKTAEQLKSGETAYLLQVDQPTQAWSQIIGTDDYPVLSGDANGRVGRLSTPLGYIYINGAGTEDNPYLITNPAILETARDYVNYDNSENRYFKLTADIDMSQKYGEDGASWTPIGNESNKFKGVFDGNAHEISGLYINAPNEEYRGLFGFVGTGGTVKNLTVSGTVTGKQYIGGIAGRIEEGASVYGCFNKSEVYGSRNFGGIAGVNYGAVTNCANAGSIGDNKSIIAADSYCGGILGANYGGITRCVNAGTVGVMYIGDIKGGIIGYNESENAGADCYYLRASTGSTRGVGKGFDNTISVTPSRLKSGETAWLLQNGQDALAWGQKLGTDDYPIPTSDSGKQVFKVTFATRENPKFAERYANPNGKITLPDAPTAEGQVFSDWSPDPGNGNVFDENTPVTGDITVYASERTPFGGESGTIPLSAVYGEGITADLSDYVAYGDNTDTVDKFTYTIEDGNTIGASVSGSTLTVPKETGAGEYTLKIKVEEKAPLFKLMSVDDYGFEPVTLTVKVTVAKAAPTASVQPNELVFKDKEQYLVTGRTDDGTLVYSMSKDGEYSEKVPTGKDTGTYTVRYKVIGDENHSNSEPQSLEAVIRSIESISIGSYPTNMTILEGMPFDASGLTVIADCGNGETFEATGYTLSGYDTSVVGEQTVTVTYAGKTAEFQITVEAKSLTGIGLTHTPDKLIYYQGDALDITGMVITAFYDNNTFQFIDSSDLEVSELTDSVGEQTVTVTYGGQSVEFTITVLERPAETGTVETPLIEVAEFYGGKRAIISCATESAEIYYTTDGTDPTTDSDKYTAPFELTSPADIKAIAVKDDMDDSDVEEQLINVEKVAAPMASVKGEVEVGTAVKLLCTTSDAEIYYTFGDSLDENNYKKYTSEIIITGSTTIRAIAVKRGCVMSDDVTFTYTIAPPPEKQDEEVNRALLELEDAACKAGDIFSLPAYIYSENAVSDFRFTLEYDSDKFEYLGFEPGEDMPASSVSVTTDENSVTVRVTKEGMTGCEACILSFRAKPNIDSGEYILPVSNIEINAAEKSLTDIYYTDGYVMVMSEDAKIYADAFLLNSDDDVIEDVSDISGSLSAMILADITGVPEEERVTSFDAVLAFYGTNGALVTLSTTEAEMSDDMDFFIAEDITIPENAEIGAVKLMIWDGTDTMKPLAAAVPVL